MEEAPNEFEAALSYQVDKGVERNHVIMIAAGMGALALIIGLVMGSAFSERRVYNARIAAWQEINDEFEVKFADYESIKPPLEDMINFKRSKKTKKILIPWGKIRKMQSIEKIRTSFELKLIGDIGMHTIMIILLI